MANGLARAGPAVGGACQRTTAATRQARLDASAREPAVAVRASPAAGAALAARRGDRAAPHEQHRAAAKRGGADVSPHAELRRRRAAVHRNRHNFVTLLSVVASEPIATLSPRTMSSSSHPSQARPTAHRQFVRDVLLQRLGIPYEVERTVCASARHVLDRAPGEARRGLALRGARRANAPVPQHSPVTLAENTSSSSQSPCRSDRAATRSPGSSRRVLLRAEDRAAVTLDFRRRARADRGRRGRDEPAHSDPRRRGRDPGADADARASGGARRCGRRPAVRRSKRQLGGELTIRGLVLRSPKPLWLRLLRLPRGVAPRPPAGEHLTGAAVDHAATPVRRSGVGPRFTIASCPPAPERLQRQPATG